MMAAVALANLSLMVHHLILLATLESKGNPTRQDLSCSSDNLVYLINCKRCVKEGPTLPCQYIGQTSRTLRERFGEHKRGIQNNTEESVPIHINQPKHTLNGVQLIPILHINNNRDSIRLSMKKHLIEKAGTLQNGIHRTCDHWQLLSRSNIFDIHPIARASSYDF